MTNERVLGLVKKRTIMDKILEGKTRWIGHILRGGGLLKRLHGRRVVGMRPRGRKRTMMLDNIRGGSSHKELKKRLKTLHVIKPANTQITY